MSWYRVSYITAKSDDRWGVVWNDAERILELRAESESDARKKALNALPMLLGDDYDKQMLYVYEARRI